MPPLESNVLTSGQLLDSKDAARRKKIESSPAGVYFAQSDDDITRNQYAGEQSDDDISSLTDTFQISDIEAQDSRTDARLGNALSIEVSSSRNLDEENNRDLPLGDKSVRESTTHLNVPSNASNRKGCEDFVAQIGEIVETVRNCRPSMFNQDDTYAQEANVNFHVPLWEQAMNFFDNDLRAIPTVLSLEHTTEIYPDSSVSFVDVEVLEKDTMVNQHGPTDANVDDTEPMLLRQGQMVDINETSSDNQPNDAVSMQLPMSELSKTDESAQKITVVDGRSVVSHVSEETVDEDAPRPYEERILWRRKRIIVILLLVVLVAVICGIGFLARNNDPGDQGMEDELQARSYSGSTTEGPTVSPFNPVPETSVDAIPPNTETQPTIITQTSSPAEETSQPTPQPTHQISTLMPTISDGSTSTASPSEAPVGNDTSVPINYTGTIESVPILLPSYPEFRFIPWTNVTSSLQQVSERYLGYTETNWNLPGSVNNNGVDYSSFWEAQSFATIQNTAAVGVISAVASIGFQLSQWDCWVNHYQNFTWTELKHLSPISVTYVEGTTPFNVTLNVTENTERWRDDSVIILGRDLQMAMTTLGWTETNWSNAERLRYFFPTAEEGLGARPPWDQLSLTEQLAANMLCFTQELWDRIPLTEW